MIQVFDAAVRELKAMKKLMPIFMKRF